jgi:hypothetical protein
LKRGDEARAHERRLAAARPADDREEPRRSKPPEQVVGLAFAAEEEVLLVGFERTQSGERVKQIRLP